jgi:hypothetical protein
MSERRGSYVPAGSWTGQVLLTCYRSWKLICQVGWDGERAAVLLMSREIKYGGCALSVAVAA